jgi:hypothetical protein
VFWCSEEVFRRISWLLGGGGLTAPIPSLTAPLRTAGFRVVSAVVGACVLRLLVVFAPRTSSTPVATWFWQMEGRSAECVILGVRPSEFILLEFQSPSRRIFISSHSLPPLWSPDRSFNIVTNFVMEVTATWHRACWQLTWLEAMLAADVFWYHAGC